MAYYNLYIVFNKIIFNKRLEWTNQLWVKYTFVFWAWCLISSLLEVILFFLSNNHSHDKISIYAMAVQAWLGSRNDIKEIMIIFIFLGMIVMNCILISEMIISLKKDYHGPMAI